MLRMVTITLLSLVPLGFAVPLAIAAGTLSDALTGMEFVRVPAGCFTVGKLNDTRLAHAVAKPAAEKLVAVDHGQQLQEFDVLDDAGGDQSSESLPATPRSGQICVHSFWMSKYEVTQGQYEQIMGDNPSAFKKGDDYPVEGVRWFDARKFIRKLNQHSGNRFRMPSEAEWEYAARSGGRSDRYGSGSSASASAWSMANSGNSTHPVVQKRPNALGL